MENRTAISIEEAIQMVMETKTTVRRESVPLSSAYGRFLAEDIYATQHVPPFDRSLYDGFAICAEDTVHASEENQIMFEIIGEIGAGSVFSGKVGPFQAVRIMTGAQIPACCNAVVMFEQTVSCHKQKHVKIKRVVADGENIFFQGKDALKGTLIAKKGTYINPGVCAALATFGFSEVLVCEKPVVGVLATGSELLEVNDSLEKGKIRNSNSYMLLSQINRAGGEAIYFGKLADQLEVCLEGVQKALQQVDLLITTGGVSVGDYDFFPEIYKQLGATVLFNKIAMRPGSVTTVAKYEDKLLFGLSGNPSASYVGFELLVRPVIRTALSSDYPHLSYVKAILKEDFPVPNAYSRLIRAKTSYEEAKLYVTSSGVDMSGAISSLIEADALIVLPSNVEGYKQGQFVNILLLEAGEGITTPFAVE
ncbi:MAG: gephyrin-like molybdotransferase Glp [Bacillus sp. (in: firmicutes)]